jgi:hypothetical protein
MRAVEDWELASRWIAWGMNDCQVSRLTGIPRSTIRDWRRLGRRPGQYGAALGRFRDCPMCHSAPLDHAAYSYLLGMYLGDGHISKHARGVYKLRIVLDDRYPGIIEEAGEAMKLVRPHSGMKVGHVAKIGCTEVYSHWKHWPCLFPQHGPGMKHTRRMSLHRWQQAIVDAEPRGLLRGLIHSDGYRGLNWVKGKGYPRYQFTNHSEEIRAIFCGSCDKMRISWRQMNRYTVSVARRDSVAKLDEFIGPKK